MQTVNIDEAKSYLAGLLEAVKRGEEVVIALAGQPIATLVPFATPVHKIAPPGSMKAKGWRMADDFNAPVDDLFDCLKDDDRLQ
jgi:prevent-host-death family protein